MHSHPEIESALNQKPRIILFYNKTKGAVDTLNRIIRSYSTKRMTRIWPLVLFYNTIDVSRINALIIWQGINHANGNSSMRQKRMFLISLGKEMREITKEAQFVAPIFATRNRNVTLAGNGALLNKRPPFILRKQKKDQKCLFFCSVANMYIS